MSPRSNAASARRARNGSSRPTQSRSARIPAHRHDDLGIACAARVPTLRNAHWRPSGKRTRVMSSSDAGGLTVSGENRSIGIVRRSVTTLRRTPAAPAACRPRRRIGKVAAQCARFWIWAAPMVRAAAASAGRCRWTSDERMMPVYGSAAAISSKSLDAAPPSIR